VTGQSGFGFESHSISTCGGCGNKRCLSWFHESLCRSTLTVFLVARVSKRILSLSHVTLRKKTLPIQTRVWQNKKKCVGNSLSCFVSSYECVLTECLFTGL